jgi:23S rRNA pseudouridine2457 synthase
MQLKDHYHFIMNKPYGFLSQFKYSGKRNKKLLGDLYDFPKRVMAVGRLDEDSEGLLLLTTDGKLSHHICSSGIEKEYYVEVDGEIDDNALEKLMCGVEIGIQGSKFSTKPCMVKKLSPLIDLPIEQRMIRELRHGSTSWISMTLTEGKYRQVRKMTAAVGYPTLRLIRVRIGNTFLDIEPGIVIEIDQFDM